MRILSVAAVLCVVLAACDSETRPLPAAPTTLTVLPAGLVGIELTSDRPRRVVGLADVVTFTVIGNSVAGEPQPVPAALFFRPVDAFEHTGLGSSYRAARVGEVAVTARYNDAAGVVHVAEQLYRVRETAALPRRLAVEGWPYERPAGLPVGGAVRLSVAAVYQDGTRDPAIDARWVSTNDDVATITPTGGLVTGVAAGTFGLEVSSSGLEARLEDLRVVAAGPGQNQAPHVRIECDPCRVETCEEVRLQAVATDPEGMALSPEWQSTRGAFSAPGDLRSRAVGARLDGARAPAVASAEIAAYAFDRGFDYALAGHACAR